MEEAIRKLLVVIMMLEPDEGLKILRRAPDHLRPAVFRGARTREHVIAVLDSMEDVSYDEIIRMAGDAIQEA
jgi:hypothetical protein